MPATNHAMRLLTGPPRTGKSTAVQAIMQRLGSERCGGFYTEEIRGERDRTGFRCVTAAGDSGVIASVDSASPVRIGRYGVDIEVFESLALPAIRASAGAKAITVIDEIGFMQMLSVPFQRMIEEIVAHRTLQVVGTVCQDSHPVIDRIKAAAGVKLYALTTENREAVREALIRELIAPDDPRQRTFTG
jgi:nucleoside-triphosphatase